MLEAIETASSPTDTQRKAIGILVQRRGNLMVGMDKHTGKALARDKHIPQSIDDILTTPKGTRVMRRDYGVSFLAEDGTLKSGVSGVDIASEATELLKQHEPRIRLGSVSATMNGDKLSAITVNYTDVEETFARETRVEYS